MDPVKPNERTQIIQPVGGPPPDKPRKKQQGWIIAGVVAAVAVLGGLGAFLLLGGTKTQQTSASVSSAATGAGSTLPGDTSGLASGGGGSGGAGGSGGGGDSGGSGGSGGGSSGSTSGLAIVSFSVSPSSVTCKSGQKSPLVSVAWKTSNASSVDLLVDGNSQGAVSSSGSKSVPSVCGESSNTFTIVASGSGKKVMSTRTISVSNGTATSITKPTKTKVTTKPLPPPSTKLPPP